MVLTTQVGMADSLQAQHRLAAALKPFNILVLEPSNTWLTKHASTTTARYQTELRMFEAIANSSFHVIDDTDSPLGQPITLQITYAMSMRKPLVLRHRPIVSDDVHLPLRRLVENNIEQMYVIDFHTLPPSEIAGLFTGLPESIDYGLSDDERALVQQHCRAYFRQLLALS